MTLNMNQVMLASLNENHIVFPAVLVEHFVKKKPVKRPSSPGILVAKWLEHPPGDTEVVGLISRYPANVIYMIKFLQIITLAATGADE